MRWWNETDVGLFWAYLDRKYRDDLGRLPRETWVDPSGRLSWALVYAGARERGSSHAAALDLVNREINRDVGLAADRWPGEEWVPIPPAVPEPEPVPVPAPVVGRRWRSDFLGRWDRPLLMYGGMSVEERAEQRAWMLASDHVTVPLAVHNDYPRFARWHWNWWRSPERLREQVIELQGAGLVPVVVLHPLPASSMRQHLAAVRELWPAIAEVVSAVTWGWEINDLGGEWANGHRQLDYLGSLRTICGVPIWVHFTPERWSGWPGYDGADQDRDEVEWLRRARQLGVAGLCYQEPPDKPEAEVVERMLAIPSPHGWSPGICGRVTDGAGLEFVAFEFAREEARHRRIVRALEGDARVTGWC